MARDAVRWVLSAFDHRTDALDHVIPRAQGGPNALWNLRLACSPCHHGRHHGPRR